MDVSIQTPTTVNDLFLSLQHEEVTTRVVCSGEITPTTAPDLNQAFIMAIGTEPAALHIDMTEIESVSFEGIIALLRAARWCSESEIVFRLEPAPVVTDALRVAGLSWLGIPEEGREVDELDELVLRARAYRRLIETPSVM